jgi:CheY-like chemotaxis protein
VQVRDCHRLSVLAETAAMILIVDDYPDGAEALCHLITREGYPCKWVPGGNEALAAIRSYPRELPLLVLLDHMMPDVNGIEVVRNLRKDPTTASLAVVMFSAGFSKAAREEAMALGVRNWLLKGEDTVVLLNALLTEYESVGGVKNQPDDRAKSPS